MSDWISCKNKLPANTDDVLVTDINQNLWVGSYYVGGYYLDGYWEDSYGYVTDKDKVIAWMPLPEPYIGE